MTTKSPHSGILEIRNDPGANNEAASNLHPLFFVAPESVTVPESGSLAEISKCAISVSYDSASGIYGWSSFDERSDCFPEIFRL